MVYKQTKNLPQNHGEENWKDKDLNTGNRGQNNLRVLVTHRNNVQKERSSALAGNFTNFDQIANCVQKTVEHNRNQRHCNRRRRNKCNTIQQIMS